jgi:hypothetical protein
MGARLLCARLRMGVGTASRKRKTRMNQGMGIANERLSALKIIAYQGTFFSVNSAHSRCTNILLSLSLY